MKNIIDLSSNCLFRALADQLDGSDDGHLRYRRIIVKYLADHREEFEPFVEDNRSFDEHGTNHLSAHTKLLFLIQSECDICLTRVIIL